MMSDDDQKRMKKALSETYWDKYNKSKGYSKSGFTELSDTGYVIYVDEQIGCIALTRMMDDAVITLYPKDIFDAFYEED